MLATKPRENQEPAVGPSLTLLPEGLPGNGRFNDPRRFMPKEKTVGGQADLWMVRDLETGEDCVLKLYRYGVFQNQEIATRIAGMEQTHVVRIIESGIWADQFYEILEYAPEGSLRGKMSEPWSHEVTKRVAEEISDALEHLHDSGVIHADLKPENVLIRQWDTETGDIDLILTDFGSSKTTEISMMVTSIAASPMYLAPEAALSTPSRNSDYFALGMILLEGLRGDHTLKGLNFEQLYMRAASKSRTPVEGTTEPWTSIIKGMLEPDSTLRGTYRIPPKQKPLPFAGKIRQLSNAAWETTAVEAKKIGGFLVKRKGNVMIVVAAIMFVGLIAHMIVAGATAGAADDLKAALASAKNHATNGAAFVEKLQEASQGKAATELAFLNARLEQALSNGTVILDSAVAGKAPFGKLDKFRDATTVINEIDNEIISTITQKTGELNAEASRMNVAESAISEGIPLGLPDSFKQEYRAAANELAKAVTVKSGDVAAKLAELKSIESRAMKAAPMAERMVTASGAFESLTKGFGNTESTRAKNFLKEAESLYSADKITQSAQALSLFYSYVQFVGTTGTVQVVPAKTNTGINFYTASKTPLRQGPVLQLVNSDKARVLAFIPTPSGQLVAAAEWAWELDDMTGILPGEVMGRKSSGRETMVLGVGQPGPLLFSSVVVQ